MDFSQYVRLRPRARTCTFVMLTMLVTMAATFLTAAEARASRFFWKSDKSGDWTVEDNWNNIDDDPVGYPNGPDDVVTIATQGTTNRVITIPKNTTITIARLALSASQFYRITGLGDGASQGTLVFDSGSAADAEVAMFSAETELRFTLPVRLERSLSVNVAPTARVSFYNGISQFLFARSLTKTGGGTLEFQGYSNYSGTTSVTDGVLELKSIGSIGVEGPLEVGDGFGAIDSAKVVVWESDQINSKVVNVKADGLLEFNAFDAIGNLSMNDGRVVVKHDLKLRLASLDMTGGIVSVDVGSECTLDGDVTATSSAVGPAILTGSLTGALHLSASRTFHVGLSPRGTALEIRIAVTGAPSAALIKDGAGNLVFGETATNTYSGPTQVLEGQLVLLRTGGAVVVPGDLQIGFGPRKAAVILFADKNIAETSSVAVGPNGLFAINTSATLRAVSLTQGSLRVNGDAQLTLMTPLETLAGDIDLNHGRLVVANIVAANANEPSRIYGAGVLVARGDLLRLDVADGPPPIDLEISSRIESLTTQGIDKGGPGTARFSGNNVHKGPTTIFGGTLVVTGRQPASLVRVTKGTLAGIGTVGNVIGEGATIAPGLSPGRLTTGSLKLSPGTTVAVEMNGPEPGIEYDQLAASGTVTLANAVLSVSADVVPPSGAFFTIIDNDGSEPVDGTFANLPEGSTLAVQGVKLTISYRGGDGNDVVLSNGNPFTYFLAEGATGAFFDNDILIANPNTADAPVTLTFLKEGGSTVVVQRTVPAQGRLTVHVEEIPGLEDASASTQVTSENQLPLIVERTMFWDASYYGGHTANAVGQPRKRWIFAEGSQGFFDTYLLIANANAEPTTATLTFLRENATPFVTTVPIAPFARKTVYAGDYPELAGRAFGVIVEATQPMIAERAMYFAKQPGRIWVGGHVNTGIVEPSTSWFHAEGATGRFFTTFILLSNPQDSEANVELRFLLDNGTVVTKNKTIGPQQRLTINPAVEDAQLANAALSTVVQSDVPIVSERSMYWQEGDTSFGEGHNSTGVVNTTTRWGLAEGRVGGPREFVTYILLANPSATAADVSVTYLREGGAPIVETYTVPPTSRFNIDVKNVVPELEGTSFGAVVAVTNGVPIAVERSLYWNANGALWAGGSNALGTPIPQP